MRIAEAELAEEIAAAGVLTVLDGTLAAVRAPRHSDRRLRQDAPPADSCRPSVTHEVPRIAGGQRTSLFLNRQGQVDRAYSCYLRLADAEPPTSPVGGHRAHRTAGIRQSRHGLRPDRTQSRPVAPPLCGRRPRDPRAPQNLQPIGALERQLRHHLGDPALAVRAVREAVRRCVPSRVDDRSPGEPAAPAGASPDDAVGPPSTGRRRAARAASTSCSTTDAIVQLDDLVTTSRLSRTAPT